MSYEMKINSGTIFKNDYKKEDKHPDYKGKINVDGEERDVALWVKKSDKGSFFSVKLSEPKERKLPEPEDYQHTKEIELDDDSLPF